MDETFGNKRPDDSTWHDDNEDLLSTSSMEESAANMAMYSHLNCNSANRLTEYSRRHI